MLTLIPPLQYPGVWVGVFVLLGKLVKHCSVLLVNLLHLVYVLCHRLHAMECLWEGRRILERLSTSFPSFLPLLPLKPFFPLLLLKPFFQACHPNLPPKPPKPYLLPKPSKPYLPLKPPKPYLPPKPPKPYLPPKPSKSYLPPKPPKSLPFR